MKDKIEYYEAVKEKFEMKEYEADVLSELVKRGEIRYLNTCDYVIDYLPRENDVSEDSIISVIKDSEDYKDAYYSILLHVESLVLLSTAPHQLVAYDSILELKELFPHIDIEGIIDSFVEISVDVKAILRRVTIPLNIIITTDEEEDSEFTMLNYEELGNTGLDVFSRAATGWSLLNVLMTELGDSNSIERQIQCEYMNIINPMTALTFPAKVSGSTVFEYIKYKKDQREFPPKASIKLESGLCGLVDYFNGGGSLMNIEIKEPVTIPIENIRFEIDGMNGYPLKEIYGTIERSPYFTISFEESVYNGKE